MSNSDEHALIDGYLRKSLLSRMMAWFFRLLILSVLLLFGSFIAWRMLSGSSQQNLRDSYPVVEQAAAFLEEKGFAPYTVDIIAQEEREQRSGNKGDAGDRKVASAISETQQSSRQGARSSQQQSAEAKRQAKIQELQDSGQNMVFDFNVEPKQSSGQDVNERLKAIEAFNERQLKKAETAIAEIERREAAIRETKESIAAERISREAATQRFLREAGLSVSWRPWDPHYPPTWEDFKNQNIDQEISKWGAYISSTFITTYNGNRWEVIAVMIPESSWVRPGNRTESTLRHERLHFDITELFARKVRVMIPQTPRRDVNKLFSKIHLELRDFQRQYDRECHGDREKQAEWEKKIAERLKETHHLQWVNKPDRLAKGGFAQGSFLLAQIYDHGGIGYNKSPKLAKKWYKLGIQKKSTYAMNNLAALYQKGLDGEPPNQKRAFKLYLRAARGYNPYAQFNLGVMYWRGLGTEPNREKAMEWFVKAADSVPYARKALLILESEN